MSWGVSLSVFSFCGAWVDWAASVGIPMPVGLSACAKRLDLFGFFVVFLCQCIRLCGFWSSRKREGSGIWLYCEVRIRERPLWSSALSLYCSIESARCLRCSLHPRRLCLRSLPRSFRGSFPPRSSILPDLTLFLKSWLCLVNIRYGMNCCD